MLFKTLDGMCFHWLLLSADTVKFSFTGIILPKEHKLHWMMNHHWWFFKFAPQRFDLKCKCQEVKSSPVWGARSAWFGIRAQALLIHIAPGMHPTNDSRKGKTRFQKGLRDRTKKLKLYYGPKIYLLIEDLQDKKNWNYHFPKPPQVCHSCLHSPITWVPSASISWCR